MDTTADDPPLDLVFMGECLDGYDPLAVKHTLAAALRLDEKRADRLFSGRRIIVRRQVDVVAAHRYIAKFALLGAVLHAEVRDAPAVPRHVPVLSQEFRPRRRLWQPRWLRWLSKRWF